MKPTVTLSGLLVALALGAAACSGTGKTPPAGSATSAAATIVGSKYPSESRWTADTYVFLSRVDGDKAQDGYREWAIRKTAAPGRHTLDVGIATRTFLGGGESAVRLPVDLAAGKTYRLRATPPSDPPPPATFVWLEDERGHPVSEQVAVATKQPEAVGSGGGSTGGKTGGSGPYQVGPYLGGRTGSPMQTR